MLEAVKSDITAEDFFRAKFVIEEKDRVLAVCDDYFFNIHSISNIEQSPEDGSRTLLVFNGRLRQPCGRDALVAGDYETVGKCMYATHDGLSKDYEVSCEELDFLNDIARHQMVFLAEHAGKLVHYSAVHAAVVVLGALADTGKLELVDAVAVERTVAVVGTLYIRRVPRGA